MKAVAEQLATGASFGGVAAASLTTAQAYDVVDKIVDKVDVGAFGKVVITPSTVYVTPNSFVAPITATPDIQRAIDVAVGTDTVRVEAGSYAGTTNTTAASKDLTLAGGSSPGIVTATDLTLNALNVLAVEIDGTAGAGNVGGHDQWVINGPVNLGGATLTLTSTAALLPQYSAYKIIENDGIDPISGTFAGLPEGAPVTVGGRNFIISYVGGSGNDVILFDPAIIEFDDTLTSDSEGTAAVSSQGPTLVVKGDISVLSDAQRTISLSLPATTEVTSNDVNVGSINYTVPAGNYLGGADPASRFNLIQKA